MTEIGIEQQRVWWGPSGRNRDSHKTALLKQYIEDNEPRDAIHNLEQRLDRLTLTLCHSDTPIENVLDKYTETLCTAQKKTSLESSLLHDISILNGQDSSQLEDWLTDIESASELTGKSRTKLAQAKSRGLVRTLICTFNCTKELGGN